MNKQAAEKIATEYYTLGVQLALHQSGLVKEAALPKGLPKEVVKKLIQAPTAGVAGVGGGKGFIELVEQAGAAGAFNQLPEALRLSLVLGTAGAGGMAAAHLAGKGVDKVPSLLSKLRK